MCSSKRHFFPFFFFLNIQVKEFGRPFLAYTYIIIYECMLHIIAMCWCVSFLLIVFVFVFVFFSYAKLVIFIVRKVFKSFSQPLQLTQTQTVSPTNTWPPCSVKLSKFVLQIVHKSRNMHIHVKRNTTQSGCLIAAIVQTNEQQVRWQTCVSCAFLPLLLLLFFFCMLASPRAQVTSLPVTSLPNPL